MKDRIRQIRKDMNMNQTEFGAEIGATQKMVTTYETGAVLPDKPIRLLICEKFNVNPVWLETGEGAIYKEQSGISPDLLLALRNMPAVKAALERLLPRLTVEDMEHINALVQKIIDGE
jgi:DNA-binding XRE family transcriptional regulator